LDSNKPKEKDSKEKEKFLFALYRAFIPQYQQCLDALKPIRSDVTIEREVDISINIYQSLLARTLIKLWCAISTCTNNLSHHSDILTFMKQEIPDKYINEEFLKISMIYVAQAKKGHDVSLVVPHVLEKSKEVYRKIAQENFDEFNNQIVRAQAIFQSGYTQELAKLLNELGIKVDAAQVKYVKSSKN